MSQTKAQLLDGSVVSVAFSAGSAAAPSIYYSADTTTGLYFPGAGQVAISTSGTGRLFVSSAGLVGIGTSSPNSSYKLDVAGAILSSSSSSEIAIVNRATNAAAWAFYSQNGEFNIYQWSAATNRLVIDTSGRVGIGTSSPGAALDVSGNIRLSAGSPNIEFNNGGAMVYGPAGNTLAFATGGGPASPVERFRIGSAGQLGIGGATYGTAGQVLTSGGASAAPTWATVGGGKILQVAQAVKSDTFSSTTKGSYVAVTGLSVTLTPSSVNSKFLIFAEVTFDTQNNYPVFFHIYKNGSRLTPAGNSTGFTPADSYTSIQQPGDARAWLDQQTLIYLDSPATTSSLTYQIYAAKPSIASSNLIINTFGSSNITVMEVAS